MKRTLLLLSIALPMMIEFSSVWAAEIKKLEPIPVYPGAKSLILPASSFVGNGITYTSDSASGEYNTSKPIRAPLHLPDGAIIRVFSVYLQNRTTAREGIEMMRLGAFIERAEFSDPSTATQITMAYVETPDVKERFYGIRSDASIREPRVDNSRFLYQVVVSPRQPGKWVGNYLAVKAVKIVYTLR